MRRLLGNTLPVTVSPAKRKSPVVASAMSAFLPGAGQIYAHRTARGLILLVATLALAPIYIGIGLWIWQIFDAASCVKRGL